MSQRDYDFLFRLMLVGETGVGKSSLLIRFAENRFSEKTLTSSIDFKFQTFKVDRKVIKLQIWDTAGQERFQTLTSAYFRRADGILLLFDITDMASFHRVDRWLGEVNKFAPENTVKVLVGTKADRAEERAVSIETAMEYANKLGIPYLETSAKQPQLTAFSSVNNNSSSSSSSSSGAESSGSSNVDLVFRTITAQLRSNAGSSSGNRSSTASSSNATKKLQADDGGKRSKSDCC